MAERRRRTSERIWRVSSLLLKRFRQLWMWLMERRPRRVKISEGWHLSRRERRRLLSHVSVEPAQRSDRSARARCLEHDGGATGGAGKEMAPRG